MRLWIALLVAACAWGQPEWRETEMDGRIIRYQVVNGEAIWQGDIVLGPAERIGKGERASVVINGQNRRWTNNVIPYEIDDNVPNKERVEGAIRHWNENTPLRLTPRQGEANYVQFRQMNGVACSSFVGMIGGRQFITLPDSCSMGSIIHEIGHAAGLYHTQSREDRDTFIRVNQDGIERDNLSQYAQQITNADDVGAYPYDSIMHYTVSGFALAGQVATETIPSGIPIGQRDGLSASDIDTITRIYGGQPARTTIAANPSGLEVTVDGVRVRTPATFDWPAGSLHELSVDDSATGTTELRFGRWSDFGARTHRITASPGTTVYTVHMRRFFRFPVSVLPANSGRIDVQPPPEEGFVPDGVGLQLRAEPAPGFAFTNWSGFGFFSTHGDANPIRFAMTSPQLAYSAGFTRSTITTITTSPPGLRIQVDGTAYTSPRQFVWTAGTRHDISIETLNQTTLGGAATHSWSNWSDGGAQRHTITATGEGGTITARFDTQFQVLTSVSPGVGGRIVLDPPAAAGFLPAGSTVTITAVPNSGFAFTGWSGNLPGTQAQRTVTVDGTLDLQARFAQPFTLTAAALVHGATFFSGSIAPGQIVTLFGAELGPDELSGLTLTAERRVSTIAAGVRVLFDGTPAPLLYVSSRQIGAIVPFNVAGKSIVRVQLEYNNRLTNALTVPVARAAPGFFTANSAGRGAGAFLNSDGSLNTEANPAERGSIVVLYATGLGIMSPAMADGTLAAPPYPQPVNPFTVRIAGRECEVLYGGAAPGFVAGLVQLNVRVPEDIGPGVVPVSLESAGVDSPRTVSMAVR